MSLFRSCPPFRSGTQVGQEIEVRPGIVSRTQDGRIQCKPILSCIVSLFAETNELQYAVPGGLIGEAGMCVVTERLTYWWVCDMSVSIQETMAEVCNRNATTTHTLLNTSLTTCTCRPQCTLGV